MNVLQHEAEEPAQLWQWQLSHIDTVDENPPLRDVVEPQQQVDERRLPCPGGTHHTDSLARPHLERDVLQDVVGAVVREPDVVEDDVASLSRLASRGSRLVSQSRIRSFEQRIAERRAATRITIGVSSNLKMRSDEAIAACSTLNFSDMSLIGRKKRCEYEQKRHERAERQRALDGPAAAEPDEQRGRQRADDFDRGVKHRVIEDRFDVGVTVLAVDGVEALVAPPFATEQLHRRHAGDVLLQKRIDPRDPDPDRAVRLANVLPEPLRDQHDERQDRERQQRQPPVHHDQDDHDAEEREDVAEDRHNAGSEKVVEDVDVCRHPRHQPADRIAVVELQVDALQVLVDLHAHVEHDALAGHLQNPRLQVLERERREQDGKKRQRNPVEPRQIRSRDMPIDRHLHQIWLRELQHRSEDDRGERDDDAEAVRPEITQQPPHQDGVVGLTEDFFVVVGQNQLPASSCSLPASAFSSAFSIQT